MLSTSESFNNDINSLSTPPNPLKSQELGLRALRPASLVRQSLQAPFRLRSGRDTGRALSSKRAGGGVGWSGVGSDLGSRRARGSRALTALGARRAPPAALGVAGYWEPPPLQLSQSLQGERGGVRGSVKRRHGQQVSKIAARGALRSPNSQPVGRAPAY